MFFKSQVNDRAYKFNNNTESLWLICARFMVAQIVLIGRETRHFLICQRLSPTRDKKIEGCQQTKEQVGFAI